MAAIKTIFQQGSTAQKPQEAGTRTKVAFFRTAPPPDKLSLAEQLNPPVKPLVYPEVSDGDYGISHIKAKPSLGVSMSGGGFRATTCASGWMRGLHNTKLSDGSTVLSNTRYLTTTSGGSWFNGAFSYKAPKDKQQVPVDTFCGPYIPPEKLDLATINKPPAVGSYDSIIAKSSALDALLAAYANDAVGQIPDLMGKLLANATGRGSPDVNKPDQDKDAQKPPEWLKPWTAAIAKSFLAPYGLNVFNSATLSAACTKGEVDKKRAAKYADNVILACTDPGRPYPILMGSAFNPAGDDGLSLYPYEFTPLYFGTPGVFEASAPPLGGGYIEPWGLHGTPTALKSSEDGCVSGEVEVCRDGSCQGAHLVPLAQAVAISSGFLAAGAHNKKEFMQKLASTEKLYNWGLVAKDGATPPSGQMGFADGGTTDNLGLSPLLRRGVKSMIVFSASSAPPDKDWQAWAAEASDTACWFGCATASYTPDVTASELNDWCHVFGNTRLEGERMFREMFESLHDKLRKGEPPFYRGTYTIKQNNFHNIPAQDESVDILWIFNHQWAAWEHSLPTETRKQLNKDRSDNNKDKGIHHRGVMERKFMEGEMTEGPQGFMKQNNLYRFPYFTTFALDFQNGPTNMLSQQCTAVLMAPQVQEEIQDLVQKAKQAAGA